MPTGKRVITIDGVEHVYTDQGPVSHPSSCAWLADGLDAFFDALTEYPPFSWFDWFMGAR